MNISSSITQNSILKLEKMVINSAFIKMFSLLNVLKGNKCAKNHLKNRFCDFIEAFNVTSVNLSPLFLIF
jgi:hypothetical protein